jgi:hypothetical protein
VVVNCGVNNSAGVLAVEGSSGNWTISVLSSVYCNILVFIPINGSVSSGYGLATYDATGRLLFDSSKNILNARSVANLAENVSFQSAAGVDGVAYTSGPVKPSKTESSGWVLVEYLASTVFEYSCWYENQYICRTTTNYVCSYDYVCTSNFVCGIDYMGNFSCGSELSCGYAYNCNYVPVTSCGFELVQVCGYVTSIVYSAVEAYVRTTDWQIERGTALVNSNGQVAFRWLLHKSGMYKTIVDYRIYSTATSATGTFPTGYTPPAAFIVANEASSGELTKNNVYPYTTTRANTGALGCIATVGSDYV